MSVLVLTLPRRQPLIHNICDSWVPIPGLALGRQWGRVLRLLSSHYSMTRWFLGQETHRGYQTKEASAQGTGPRAPLWPEGQCPPMAQAWVKNFSANK